MEEMREERRGEKEVMNKKKCPGKGIEMEQMEKW